MSPAPWSAFPLVLVEWGDAHQQAGWKFLADLETEIQVCWSVGWLVHDGESAKVIAPHFSAPEGQAQANGTMTIPAGAVRRLVRLVEGGADATG